jgi:hypothetical protein
MKPYLLAIFVALTLLIPKQIHAADDPISKSPAAKSVLGTVTDWQVYLMETLKYAKIREMVKNAYIEVQTWRALKANWERQKNWFDRNKRRWERIKENLQSASSEGTVFQRMRKLGDVTNDIDQFAVVETQRWDNIMVTYEDNASQMWDIAGSMMNNRLVSSQEIWTTFDKLCRTYGFQTDPGTGIPTGATLPTSEHFNLEAFKRRKFLGKTFSHVAAQSTGMQMQRNLREEYWDDFALQMNAAMSTVDGKGPLADAINGQDLLRRTQTLADINDLILQRTIETQLLMTLLGDEHYKLSSELANVGRGASEARKIAKILKN